MSRLYTPGLSGGNLALLLVASLIVLVIAIVTIPALDNLFELLWLKIRVLLGL